MSKTTSGPVWRELNERATTPRVCHGWRRLTADLPGEVVLWIEKRRGATSWTVDVAVGKSWIARDEDGGPTLATAKRRAMDLAVMRKAGVGR